MNKKLVALMLCVAILASALTAGTIAWFTAEETMTNTFTDVKSSDYYYKAVLWAAKNGITSGKSATAFGPADSCVRSHMVTFLYNHFVK